MDEESNRKKSEAQEKAPGSESHLFPHSGVPENTKLKAFIGEENLMQIRDGSDLGDSVSGFSWFC